ncbi:hypothetical protein Athai_49920 [Actinocatenispora thailandica]|uniref:Alkaline shock response membrane anchor protein AmaP n=1 Tax=Actinocatenispora thailandica TaxID=227318 RepID=A0A7R7HZM0_9ACTN|nr:hypothetical protein [Actinocatenispora thailandica]BCJ37489.1 hypothetical protein Athai_49920 [Actinocatenispora thailandica]
MDRGNRVLFAIVGAVLLVGGLAVGVAGLGLVPAVDSSTRLLPAAVRDRWHDWGTTAWIVTALAGVLLAALGVLLVRAQLVSGRGRPMPDLLLTDPVVGADAPDDVGRGADAPDGVGRGADAPGGPGPGEEAVAPGAGAGADGSGNGRAPGPGRTRVRAVALVHGIERDLARHPKVRRVSVALGGDAAEPRVYARLELRADADVPHVQAYLSESLARFTRTTGLAPTDVDVVLQLTGHDQLRVH